MRLAYVTSNHVAITSWSSMSNSQFSVQGGYKVVAQASGVGGSAGNASHAVNDFRKIALLRDPTKSNSAVTTNTARLLSLIHI